MFFATGLWGNDGKATSGGLEFSGDNGLDSENEKSGITVTCQTTGQWTHTEVWWAPLAVVGTGSTWHVVFRL